MRYALWIVLLSNLLAVVGCANNNLQSARETTLASPPVTGSALSTLRGNGAMPVDIYNADQLRAQGITTASGALQDIPQNDSR